MKEILGEILAEGYFVPFVSEDRVKMALLSQLHQSSGQTVKRAGQ